VDKTWQDGKQEYKCEKHLKYKNKIIETMRQKLSETAKERGKTSARLEVKSYTNKKC